MLGGWFHSVATLRLSQPSLAGVGAGAEFGNYRHMLNTDSDGGGGQM